MSSLQLIRAVPVTSGVTAFSIDNCFNTGTYLKHRIVIKGVYQSSDVQNFINGIRLIDNSGSVITGNEYNIATHTTATYQNFSDEKSTGIDYWDLANYADQLSEGQTSSVVEIFNANVAEFTMMTCQSMGGNSDGNLGGHGTGVHRVAEIIRGFQLYESTGANTFGGGSIAVYGVR